MRLLKLLKDILEDDDRKFGVKGGPKYAKRMQNTKAQERKYNVMKYGNFDDEAKHYIHLGSSDMESFGFNKGPRWFSEKLPDGKTAKLPLGIRKRDGVADHYHFSRAALRL